MKTVLEILVEKFPESSKNTLRSWLEKGRVSIEGTVVTKASEPVGPAQKLHIGPNVSFAEEEIKILFEDPYLVVIDKPTKLLSVATDSEAYRTAYAILKRRRKGRIYPVHRLDRDTSGVMVFAYNMKAQGLLKKQFAAHTVERVYFGLVEGHLSPPKGMWQSRLVEDEGYVMRSSTQGELAITYFEEAEKFKETSLVKFTLKTGKKNQIRVHTSEAGHPIVGDKKYGSTTRYSRLCLHAHILGFIHPITNKKFTFTSPLPSFVE